MEFAAHQKSFAFLLTTGMLLKAFISDRHASIAKWIREECTKKCKELGKPIIDHFFDLWHIGKSIIISSVVFCFYYLVKCPSKNISYPQFIMNAFWNLITDCIELSCCLQYMHLNILFL